MADALSHRCYPTLSGLIALPDDLCKEFGRLELNVVTPGVKPTLYALEVQPTLIEEIRTAQAIDPQLERKRDEILVGKAPGFVIHENGTIRFHNRVCVPAVEELKRKILNKGHNTPHLVHPRGNKPYKDLNQTFWWSNMKREVVDYVARCLTCQRVKIEHQRPAGHL